MITALRKTSEPFHYHERVIGDVWLKLDAPEPPTGQAWSTVLAGIESARHSLHIATPLLGVPAFNEAVARALSQHRIRVYILTTDGLAPQFDAPQKQVHAEALAKLSAAGAILHYLIHQFLLYLIRLIHLNLLNQVNLLFHQKGGIECRTELKV